MCVQVPHLAALQHMDCQHLAQELLLMPHCYSPLAGSAGCDPLRFLAAALQLREAGRTCLDRLVCLPPTKTSPTQSCAQRT